MKVCQLLVFLAFLCSFVGCTVERAEEQVIATHANGVKKTSVWVYPDGEILKRNEWYNDGIKELEIPYKDNVPHGEFKRWTGFGDVAMIGYYKKGLRDGKWTSYYVERLNSRKKEAERYYKDDHPVGDWEGWHYDGTKAFEEHYNEKGDSIGVWKKWSKSGKLLEENSCHGGDSAGTIVEYYDNGKRRHLTGCRYGVLHGPQITYAADEKNSWLVTEGYTNGVLDGAREFYLPSDDGLRPYRREHWEKGVRDSIWRLDDGLLHLVIESEFVNGTGIGYGQCEDNYGMICAETSFVANVPGGTLDSSAILGRTLKGATLWYYKKGHDLRYEEFWENGEIAVSRSFYPDSLGGKLASEAFWKEGKRNGILRNWYASGILRDSLSYVNGERVGEQFSYDSTGKLTIHKTEAGKNRPVIMHKLWEE
jgi:antitoxin component YwqK of YwqJK toxin-antitoxin module